jgi:hypothetical protein
MEIEMTTVRRRRGRPSRIEGEAASERIWGYLTASEKRAMQAVARDLGVTVGELLRDAVNDYVAEVSERPGKIFATGNSLIRPS